MTKCQYIRFYYEAGNLPNFFNFDFLAVHIPIKKGFGDAEKRDNRASEPMKENEIQQPALCSETGNHPGEGLEGSIIAPPCAGHRRDADNAGRGIIDATIAEEESWKKEKPVITFDELLEWMAITSPVNFSKN